MISISVYQANSSMLRTIHLRTGPDSSNKMVNHGKTVTAIRNDSNHSNRPVHDGTKLDRG